MFGKCGAQWRDPEAYQSTTSMQYTRLLHPLWWSDRDQRFSDISFKPSSEKFGGGISVVEVPCAEASTGTVCAHLHRYYSERFNIPILFWRFDGAVFPDHTLEAVPGPKGDPCHRNIHNVTSNKAKKHFAEDFKNHGWANFFICEGEGPARPMTQEDVPMWKLAHDLQQAANADMPEL